MYLQGYKRREASCQMKNKKDKKRESWIEAEKKVEEKCGKEGRAVKCPKSILESAASQPGRESMKFEICDRDGHGK